MLMPSSNRPGSCWLSLLNLTRSGYIDHSCNGCCPLNDLQPSQGASGIRSATVAISESKAYGTAHLVISPERQSPVTICSFHPQGWLAIDTQRCQDILAPLTYLPQSQSANRIALVARGPHSTLGSAVRISLLRCRCLQRPLYHLDHYLCEDDCCHCHRWHHGCNASSLCPQSPMPVCVLLQPRKCCADHVRILEG